MAYLEDQPAQAGLLPPALHALLAARLDRLGDDERSALAYGAIVGDAFDSSPVHALADDMTRAALEQASKPLVAHALLERRAGHVVGERVDRLELERVAHDRAVRERRPLVVAEPVEAGREQRMERRRQQAGRGGRGSFSR